MKRLPILIVRAVGIGLLMGAATCTCTATYYYDYCDPAVPSAECYRDRRDPDSTQVAAAEAVALRYIENHPAEEELWDWKSGVLMFALTELNRVTENEALLEALPKYYRAWLDHHIEVGYDLYWSDSCPPGITAVALLSEKSTDEYQQVVDDILEYLDETAPRTEEGGISHNGTFGTRPSMWLDSLFMFGMVLNRYGELADPERLEMMSEQIQIFADALQDDSGFMRHAENWLGYDDAVYWARGNGWVVASLADYLRITVEQGPRDPEVEEIFRKQVGAILGAQDESGLWPTVMSHPDEDANYLETSASALFAYGIARAWRYGLLSDDDRKLAQKAVARIVESAIADDVITGVSMFTDPWSLEQYLHVPVQDDLNYGVGAVILALIETSGLPE